MTQPQILHVSTVHGPLDGRIFYKEVRSLRDAGFRVAIAGTAPAAAVCDGVPIVPLGSRDGPRWKRLGRDLRALGVMLAHGKSILHIHDPELLLVALLPAYMGHTVVYDVHEFYRERIADSEWIPLPLRSLLAGAYDRLERVALRRFAGVVIVSDAMREHYGKLVGDDRVALVRSFPYIRPAELDAVRNSPHPLDGKPYILHTGGASRLRAFHTMVGAAEYLRERGCNWPIVNLGPVDLSAYGSSVDELLERARRAGVRNVGAVSQEEAWRYVAHATIGYMPLIDQENNARGMPNKLFENFILGLPMVGTRIGNIAAIVTETNTGLLVEPEDERAHGAALMQLAVDTNLRETFARNAVAAADRYSFASEAQTLIGLYARIRPDVAPSWISERPVTCVFS